MALKVNSPLFKAYLALVLIGLIQVYSSSYMYASEVKGWGYYFITRQFLFALLGVGIVLGVSQLPYTWVQRHGWKIWLIAAVGVGLTLISGIGSKAGGASRWLQLPFSFRLEPSEFLKLGFTFLLATLFSKNTVIEFFKMNFYLKALLLIFPFTLLLKQPDFGSFAICLFILATVLFAQGLKLRWFFSFAMSVIPVFYFLVWNVGYRKERILAFIDPWKDTQGRGFQVVQSILTFSNGGFLGKGLGQGQGKLFFLPESHTDFTLAVFGEENGFIGVVVLLLIYAWVSYYGVKLSLAMTEVFDRVLALSLTLLFSFSVLINSGVVMGLLPTKGLTLPFLSYGGSSVIMMSLVFGLLILLEKKLQSQDNSF